MSGSCKTIQLYTHMYLANAAKRTVLKRYRGGRAAPNPVLLSSPYSFPTVGCRDNGREQTDEIGPEGPIA